jgi:hypothetical protein
VSIRTRLRDVIPDNRSFILGNSKVSSFNHCVQIISGHAQPTIQLIERVPSPLVKRSGCEANIFL